MSETIGRNDPCHCGSGKKYKKCHLEKDEAANRKDREKAALNAASLAAKEAKENPEAVEKSGAKHRDQEQKGWVSKMASKVGFFRNVASQRRAPPANKGG